MSKDLRIPKVVAGIRVPKGVRRTGSTVMNSPVARTILANALVAVAGAAATALVRNRQDVAPTGGPAPDAGQSAGGQALTAVTDTVKSAASTLGGVVADAASAVTGSSAAPEASNGAHQAKPDKAMKPQRGKKNKKNKNKNKKRDRKVHASAH